MVRKDCLFTFLVLAALILSACQPIQPVAPGQEAAPAPATQGPMPQPHQARPDAPPYGVRGPYAVGVRDFVIEPDGDDERQLTATVWYPALNPEGAEERITYEMGFVPGDTPNFPVYGRAIIDAPPLTADGPYPLVVYTHAHWTFRQEVPYLVENLASHGFVVISADHEDNWSTLFGPKPWQSEFRRPDEVRRELDFAETLTAPDGSLAGLIDLDHTAVAGWSFGGETALVAGGARLDLASFRTWCEANTVDGEMPHADCVDILDHEAGIAALAGLAAVPQGLWPDWSDARLDAVVALAPAVHAVGAMGVETVDVPTLLVIGSGDTDVGPAYFLAQPYQHMATERRAEVVIENAEHLLFFDDCSAAPDLIGTGFHVFCSDPVWDMNRAHDLVNHFATAFLLAELKGDAEAAAALAPENVTFPGIQYETTGYGAAAVP